MSIDARLLPGSGEAPPRHQQCESTATCTCDSTLGSWEHDLVTGGLTLLGGSACLLGLDPDSFDGRWDTFLSFVHGEDRAALTAVVDQAIASGLPYELEFRVTGPDGVLRRVNERGMVLRDARGARRLGIVREMTEDRRAELEIERALERGRAAAAEVRWLTDQLHVVQISAGAGVWSLNLAEGTMYWSREYYELYGLDPSTAPSFENWLSAIHPGDRGHILTEVRADREQARDVDLEYRVLHPRLGERWLHSLGRVFVDASGQPTGVSGITLDITARKRVEEDLRRSEARYRSLIDNLPAVIYTAHPDDPTQITQYLSPHIERLLAVSAEDYRHDPAFWVRHLHPEDRDWVLAAAARSTAAREPFIHEYRLVARHGRTVWVRDEGRWVQDDQGRIICLQGVMLDISDLKQAEQTLRESEMRLRLVTEAIPQLVWTGLSNGDIDFCNQRWRSYTGLTEEQIQGDGWAAALHPDDRLRVLMAWQAAVRQGGDLEVEERLRGADGLYRWFLARATPVRGEDGHIVKWYGTCTDIQDRREAEQALRHSEERWQTILHATQDGIWEWDFQTPRLTWSQRLKAMLGYRDDELHVDPQLVLTLVHPDERARAHERLLRHRRGETSFYIDELRMRHRDGSYRWLLSRGLCVRDDAGKALRMLGTCTDITEHKRTEEALKEADRRKDEFLAMLAHELRNPLAPILNAVHVLRLLGPPDENTQKAEDMIERQVTHLARLVDDLLDVSRITRGKILLRMERLDLVALVHATVEDHRRLLETTGLVLTTELPEGPLWVMGDPTRLSQMVGNLLQNANKFTDAGGYITVRLAAERETGASPRLAPGSAPGRARLSVKDTGIGMEADILQRLFEPFSQADRSLARSRGGLGLGLALVKGLVELHGGRVQAASPGPRQGSEFTILLPLTKETEAPKKLAVSAPSARRSLGVLVIEDNQDVAESLRTVLELFGYRVAVAYTGHAGVEAYHQSLPDVVLCDIGLPGGMDGYGVARALRATQGLKDPKRQGPLRLIAVSGYGQEEDQRRALQAGFDQHLTKPIDPALLRQILDALDLEGG